MTDAPGMPGKVGDQELTPRISSMEVADGLDVSGFQGMVGLGERKEEKSRKLI